MDPLNRYRLGKPLDDRDLGNATPVALLDGEFLSIWRPACLPLVPDAQTPLVVLDPVACELYHAVTDWRAKPQVMVLNGREPAAIGCEYLVLVPAPEVPVANRPRAVAASRLRPFLWSRRQRVGVELEDELLLPHEESYCLLALIDEVKRRKRNSLAGRLAVELGRQHPAKPLHVEQLRLRIRDRIDSVDHRAVRLALGIPEAVAICQPVRLHRTALDVGAEVPEPQVRCLELVVRGLLRT